MNGLPDRLPRLHRRCIPRRLAALAIVLGAALASGMVPGLGRVPRALAAGATFGIRLEIRAPVRVDSSVAVRAGAVSVASAATGAGPGSAVSRVTAMLATGAPGTLERLPATPAGTAPGNPANATVPASPAATVVTFLIE